MTKAIRLLEGHPAGRQAIIAGNHPGLHSEGAVREILDRARSYRSELPVEASRWAMLAWSAALRVQTPAGPELQALALAEDGNARRLLGQWDRAEDRFRRAEELLADRPDTPAALEISLLISSLAIQREQWPRALAALDKSARLAQALGDDGALCRSLLKRGIALSELGEYAQAIEACLEARTVAGPSRPVERLRALHNAAVIYVDGGWYEAALAVHRGIERYYADAPPHLQAQGVWLRGRIDCGLDRWIEGAQRFAVARELLAAGSYHWELSELLCDEAEAYLRIGRVGEVLALAGVAAAAYRAMGLAGRARRAASLFRAAAGGMGAIAALAAARRMLRAQRSGA